MRSFGWGWCVLLCAGFAFAQETAPPRDPGQKSVRVARTTTRPVIDGSLDEAVWQNAARIDNFHQVNPVEYAEPSERTEIYLAYDDDALYIGARLYTPPGEITANVMRQGASITQEDSLFVTLDPFNMQRGGYFFGLNAHGVRFDGLYRNVSEYYTDWDSIWDAAAQRFDGGWTAEYEIPFKSLSFDPNSDTWGLNFSRSLETRNEDMAWVSRNRRWDPSSAGLMTGLSGLDQGIGLDIVPSASLTNRRVMRNDNPATPEDERDTSDDEFEPSLDLFYKLTPQMNAALTFNTDFSATEVDDRQVNLTRFGLFFPEKRDFFLREADIFEFGRIGASDGTGALSNAERQNARPFFSRRIGLGQFGEPVDLNYGGKISGRAGRFEVGALSIRQDENPLAGVDDTTLSVVRAKAGIGRESTIGAVFTDGDPLNPRGNSLAGFDALYRNSRLPGGRTIEAGAWYQTTDTEWFAGEAPNQLDPDGADSAAGVSVSIPSNNKFRGAIATRRVEGNFYPALGFTSRTDIRDYSGQIAYTHRPASGYWQSLFFNLDGQRIEGLNGRLQSQQIGLTPVQMYNRTNDMLYLRSNFETEVLEVPFEIQPGTIIPVGEYSFDDHGAEVGFSAHRRFSGRIAVTDGGFYNGTRARTFGSFTWAPSPHFRTGVGFNIQDIDLPVDNGQFTTRIVNTNFDIVFSSRLSWTNLIQYDNVSEIVGINLRLNWIPEAGRELFFVINHNVQDFDEDNRFHSLASDIVAKASYTFRF
ncbi:MAG TPA: carbohydrate binding family 9 domain-containing protein [Gammaproteobacteria bacterium]|nr:carbohydrate binding family 9 domain-containing protein [Gammaproteobacteria bacterium]